MFFWSVALILAAVLIVVVLIGSTAAVRAADRLDPLAVLDGTGAHGIDQPADGDGRATWMRRLGILTVVLGVLAALVTLFPERDPGVATSWAAVVVPWLAAVSAFCLALAYDPRSGGERGTLMRLVILAAAGLAFLIGLIALVQTLTHAT
ncbi:hypothetical protein [Microbacterium gorillae]|uniref:hypothetical protein n=1 Tax=Microbacterium gorillae TaxID=1231063 RepID=UPI00058C66EF|nr:hypothetical protein [Microbacterium gorillae]